MSAYIFDSNTEQREFRRLQLIESANDPTTMELLEKTGIQEGWHCLEMGPGAGSILRWLGKQVGPTGLAIGVDKKTTYLQDFHAPPFQIYESTFLEVPLAPTFDLIHGRYVLIHNQKDMAILRKMLALLKPGGWAVFEEPDFTSATLLHKKKETSQGCVNQAICQMFVNMGLNPDYALQLPGKLEKVGFQIFMSQSIMHLCPGQSPMAQVMGESALALQQQYCSTGLCTSEDIQHYVSLSKDCTYWALYHSTTSVIVRKASTSS